MVLVLVNAQAEVIEAFYVFSTLYQAAEPT
jgi:hypothetical protein